MGNWEQHGLSYYLRQDNTEYLIDHNNIGWRLRSRRVSDSNWETVSYCPTLEVAKNAAEAMFPHDHLLRKRAWRETRSAKDPKND